MSKIVNKHSHRSNCLEYMKLQSVLYKFYILKSICPSYPFLLLRILCSQIFVAAKFTRLKVFPNERFRFTDEIKLIGVTNLIYTIQKESCVFVFLYSSRKYVSWCVVLKTCSCILCESFQGRSLKRNLKRALKVWLKLFLKVLMYFFYCTIDS